MDTQNEHTWFTRMVLISCFVLALFSINSVNNSKQDSFHSITEYIAQKDNSAVLAEIVPSPDYNPTLVSSVLISKKDNNNILSKSISNNKTSHLLKIGSDRFLEIKIHLSYITHYQLLSSFDDEDLIS